MAEGRTSLGPFSLPRSRKPPTTANILACFGRAARYRKVRTALIQSPAQQHGADGKPRPHRGQ